MDNAHQICQEHEGAHLFDWVHALIHRIEGDDANAGYWYQRAGKTPHSGSIQEEWQIIRTAVEKPEARHGNVPCDDRIGPQAPGRLGDDEQSLMKSWDGPAFPFQKNSGQRCGVKVCCIKMHLSHRAIPTIS